MGGVVDVGPIGRAEPLFDPRPLGIKNADLWEKIADKRKRAG